jgi:hypothetical protein
MIKQREQNTSNLGNQPENLVRHILQDKEYQFIEKNKFTLATNILNQKLYSMQLLIDESIYSTSEQRYQVKADLVIYNPTSKQKYMIIECKSQTSSGSVDEKYPYLNENIRDKYPYKTIVILDAPKAKKGAKTWLKKQEGVNPKLQHVFQDFSEFRAWSMKNL